MGGRFDRPAASGAGWTCSTVGDVVLCERADPLAAGAGYPPSITVDVPTGAPPSITNIAAVYMAGDVNPANNTASDVTTIVPGADLTVTKPIPASSRQGQRGPASAFFYTLTVNNAGGADRWHGHPDRRHPGWSHRRVGDRRGLDLRLLGSLRDVHSSRRSGARRWLSSGDDRRRRRAGRAAIGDQHRPRCRWRRRGRLQQHGRGSTQINRGQDPAVSKSHSTDFIQGQRGVHFITVTNIGGAPTIGTVTLVDTVPDGLVPTAASGTGWTCAVSSQTSDCFRSDRLPAGASYEPITITVDVARDACGHHQPRRRRRRGRRVLGQQQCGGPHGGRSRAGSDARESAYRRRHARSHRDVRAHADQRRRRCDAGASTWSTCCLSG